MADLLATLLPLAVASAIVPIHIVITVLLLRGPAGRLAAAAWIAGMTSTRLLQGVVFGLVLAPVESAGAGSGEPALVVSVVLLVVAVALLPMAARAAVREPDEDAPPPAWMTALDAIAPGRAYLAGAGIVAIGPKFWVFTLGAIAAIGEASLGPGPSVAAFLVFAALAVSVLLTLLAAAVIVPARADVALSRLLAGLTTYGRPIKVVIGVVIGLWFLAKALDGLGVL